MKLFLALALVALVGCAVEARPHARDLKDSLTTRGNDLLKRADEALKKLEAEHRPNGAHEITIVKTEEARIKKLIADLEAATDDAKIKTIEHDLSRAEQQLTFELAKINHTVHILPIDPLLPHPKPVDPIKVVTRDLKDTLITRGNDLVKRADEAIKKLETDKKTHEATVIKSEEAKIQKLITDLQAATETTQITHLEHELGALEARLAHELNRINHTGPIIEPHLPVIKNPVTRDLKDTLITRGNDLVKRADEAIKTLEAAHKTHEVTVVKAEEARIQKLITDLQAATDAAQITHLERELGALEARLSHELTRINHTGPGPIIRDPVVPVPKTPVTRDLKDTLTTKANALLKHADAEIKKLEAANKAHEVTVIKTEEAKIKQLLAELGATTDETKLKTVEHNLSTAEHKLQTELAKIEHNGTGTKPPKPTTVAASF